MLGGSGKVVLLGQNGKPNCSAPTVLPSNLHRLQQTWEWASTGAPILDFGKNVERPCRKGGSKERRVALGDLLDQNLFRKLLLYILQFLPLGGHDFIQNHGEMLVVSINS